MPPLLALLLMLASAPQQRGQFPSDLSRWVHTEPPLPDSAAVSAANRDDLHVWRAVLVGGRMVAQPFNPDASTGPLPRFHPKETRAFLGRRSWQRVSDGWLVGLDAGEWDGSLWWFSPDGRRRYKVSDDQVHFFLNTPSGLVACEGLAHITIQRGHVTQLVRTSGRWRVARRIDLHDAPQVGLVDADGSLLLVTYGQLLRVHRDGVVEPLIKDAFWAGLYPHAITRDTNGDLYVGMRHGFALLHPSGTTYQVQWLVPDRSFLTENTRE